MSSRRVIALAIGLVVASLALAGGWLFATLRERDVRRAEARARLMRAADAVRGAVDESLEELRRREDERPFYLYQHLYSPPDVLAITDPVAVSPLARPSADPRVRAYFQIDPDGRVRTPYAADPDAAPPPLHVEVARRVRGDAFDPLRALVRGEASDTLGVAAAPEISGSGALEIVRNPDNQLTDLDRYGSSQARDILAAQRGDEMANQRVIERGRQVGPMSRRNVTWDEAVQQRAAPPRPSASRPLSRERVRATLAGAEEAVRACTPEAVRVRLRVAADGRVLRASSDPESACVVRALEALRFPATDGGALTVRFGYRSADARLELADGRDLEQRVRRAGEVVYTPMTFRALGDSWVLHRLVSHEETAVVQGVLLDEAHLRDAWLPGLVTRRVEASVAPTVVRAGAGACALRERASATLPDLELCFAPAQLAAASDGDALHVQLGALALLVLIALLAAAAIAVYARRAEALSRQKSAFVSAVSHELRTPLTTLRMHAEMLDEGMVDETRRPKVHRELVRESVRLARLVDNVLSLSKLEEGRRGIAPSPGDLRAHVREIVEAQRHLIEERGFTLEGPGPGAVPCEFDGQAVEQIVINLLDNAVKYAATGERAIEVAVEAGPVIEVRDRGPGVPEAERRKVFDRFHRVEREDTAHAPGTGIGLSLVAELAEAHGGRASVHPREGGGLRVRVALSSRVSGA